MTTFGIICIALIVITATWSIIDSISNNSKN